MPRRRTKYRVATVHCGVCGKVCHAIPQTSRDGGKTKLVRCLYCDDWVPMKDGDSIVLRFVPIPRPRKGPEQTEPLF